METPDERSTMVQDVHNNLHPGGAVDEFGVRTYGIMVTIRILISSSEKNHNSPCLAKEASWPHADGKGPRIARYRTVSIERASLQRSDFAKIEKRCRNRELDKLEADTSRNASEAENELHEMQRACLIFIV